MAPKNKRTTAAAAASTDPVKVEPLKPGHTRTQGTRVVRDHNGELVNPKPGSAPADADESPSG